MQEADSAADPGDGFLYSCRPRRPTWQPEKAAGGSGSAVSASSGKGANNQSLGAVYGRQAAAGRDAVTLLGTCRGPNCAYPPLRAVPHLRRRKKEQLHSFGGGSDDKISEGCGACVRSGAIGPSVLGRHCQRFRWQHAGKERRPINRAGRDRFQRQLLRYQLQPTLREQQRQRDVRLAAWHVHTVPAADDQSGHHRRLSSRT
jgi:hypothetical protein